MQVHMGSEARRRINVSTNVDPTCQHFGAEFPYAERASLLFSKLNALCFCKFKLSRYEDRDLQYEHGNMV